MPDAKLLYLCEVEELWSFTERSVEIAVEGIRENPRPAVAERRALMAER